MYNKIVLSFIIIIILLCVILGFVNRPENYTKCGDEPNDKDIGCVFGQYPTHFASDIFYTKKNHNPKVIASDGF